MTRGHLHSNKNKNKLADHTGNEPGNKRRDNFGNTIVRKINFFKVGEISKHPFTVVLSCVRLNRLFRDDSVKNSKYLCTPSCEPGMDDESKRIVITPF